MSCRCTPFFFFSYWKIWLYPSAFPSIYSSAFQQAFFIRDIIPDSFWDSVVDRPYYGPSPLLSFHEHAERKSWILTWKVWKFGRMFVPANPRCRHKAVTHRRSVVLARGKMKILSPIYPTIQWPKASGDMWERDFAITSPKKKHDSYSVPFIMGNVSPDTARSAWPSTNVYSKYANTPLYSATT
jgi:hypothetical protein